MLNLGPALRSPKRREACFTLLTAMITEPLDASRKTDVGVSPRGPLQWFALRVRSNFEQPVSSLLGAKGIEEFLPTYRSRRIWSDRVRDLQLPLFPGYIFCRIPMEERTLVLATTGVVNLVGVQGRPLPIDDREIAAV